MGTHAATCDRVVLVFFKIIFFFLFPKLNTSNLNLVVTYLILTNKFQNPTKCIAFLTGRLVELKSTGMGAE